MNESSYYLKVNGQMEGPFTIGQIYDLWAARKINSQTPFARYDAMENWQPLSDLTLKISAPRTAPSRPQAENDAPASAPSKPRTAVPQLSEDQLPSLTQYAPQPQPESPRKATSAQATGFDRARFSLGIFSWICVAAGLALTAGFIFFPSPSPESMNLEPRFAIAKLSGVIAGFGLLLLGGLLAVARSMEQIAASLRNVSRTSGERKPGA